MVVLPESSLTQHMELYIKYLLLLLLRLAGYNACTTVDGTPCVFPFIYQVIIHERIEKKSFVLIREENTQTAQMQQTQLNVITCKRTNKAVQIIFFVYSPGGF